MKKKGDGGVLKKRPLPTLPGDMEGTHKLEQLLLHLGLAERRAHPHFRIRILKREKHKSIDNANIKILSFRQS
jgi:hypothetical protein